MTNKKTLRDLSDLQSLLPESEQHTIPPPQKISGHDGKGKSVRIMLDNKGRKGKTVTLVSGFQHNPDTMEDIAKILKQHCGAGGTVRGKDIEIQGDQRERLKQKLVAMNYAVK